MALVSPSTVLACLGLDSAVDTHVTLGSRILQQEPKAEREARRQLGDARFDELVALDEDATDRQSLVEAVGLLCAYYALPGLNLRPSERGGLIRATGFDQSRSEVMSHREMRAYAVTFREQADELLDSLQDGAAAEADLGLAAI